MPRVSFKTLLSESSDVLRVFALGRLIHPLMVEMFGLAGGYHGFWIDQEHAANPTDQLLGVSLAARAHGFASFVRVPPTGYWQVTQCLEAGAGGVMAAQIHSVAQAEEFVRWARFAPQGNRGLNLSGMDARYTHLPAAQFVEEANQNVFIAIQVETCGAVEDAEAIAALDGVDLLFVGPADLSLSLGVVGQFHSDRLWEAIDAVAEACRKHGKNWGCVAPDPKFAARAVESGCRMPTYGNDVVVMRKGIEAVKSAYGLVEDPTP